MSSNAATPPSTEDPWEQEAARPLAADSDKKVSRYAIYGIAAVATGVVLWAHFGSDKREPSKPREEYAVAEKKAVPKLPPASEATPAPAPASAASTPPPPPLQDDALARQRAQVALQKEVQEQKMREARLRSSIVGKGASAFGGQQTAAFQGASEQGPEADGDTPPPAVAAAPGLSLVPQGQGGAGERGAQDANSVFARAVSAGSVPVSKAAVIPDLEYKILKGKHIEAKIVPRSQSDLPGSVCAQTDTDTYAEQGRMKLIPWMTRVCGTYNAELRRGQARVFFVWSELTTHEGVRVMLNSPGGDQLGMAGLGGYVDRHFAEIFGIAALISIIGAGASNAGVGSQDQYNSAAQYRAAVQQAAAQTAQQMLQSSMNIPPTVTVPEGTSVRIFINRDLDFTDLYKTKAPPRQQQPASLFTPVETE